MVFVILTLFQNFVFRSPPPAFRLFRPPQRLLDFENISNIPCLFGFSPVYWETKSMNIHIETAGCRLIQKITRSEKNLSFFSILNIWLKR